MSLSMTFRKDINYYLMRKDWAVGCCNSTQGYKEPCVKFRTSIEWGTPYQRSYDTLDMTEVTWHRVNVRPIKFREHTRWSYFVKNSTLNAHYAWSMSRPRRI